MRTIERKPFVDRKGPPNEKRFDPPESQDTKFLSTLTRAPIINFGRTQPREEDFIMKGGK